MSDSKLPSGVDRLVGQRLRWRRRQLKLTQEKLGEILDLTFQQVQKYEKGSNRISAGRLFEMAKALGVPITYFYEGAEEFAPDRGRSVAEHADEAHQGAPVLSAEALELVSEFQKISDAGLRKALINSVRAAARALDSDGEDGA